MTSPFPGMNPYLEAADIWPGFHHSLAEEIKGQLNSQIGPNYYADVEVRTVIEDVGITARSQVIYPDAAVLERLQPGFHGSSLSAVAIPEAPLRRLVTLPNQIKTRRVRLHVTETEELVTVIELLSPYNKRPGAGLNEYRRKRARLLLSDIHFLEIDLLRGGQRPGRELLDPPLDSDYVLLVNRARERDNRVSEIWPVALNDPLPLLPVPLFDPDPDVQLDMAAAMREVYKRSGYEWRIDYDRPIPPPDLRPAMASWLSSKA